jgi:sialate O-acetylesterase
LRIRFDHVNGRLLPEDRVAGFTVCEAGRTRNLACGAKVSAQSPTTVEIRTYCPIPPNSAVWYGQGMAPFCNLVDAADMAAPVFGPWNL